MAGVADLNEPLVNFSAKGEVRRQTAVVVISEAKLTSGLANATLSGEAALGAAGLLEMLRKLDVARGGAGPPAPGGGRPAKEAAAFSTWSLAVHRMRRDPGRPRGESAVPGPVFLRDARTGSGPDAPPPPEP